MTVRSTGQSAAIAARSRQIGLNVLDLWVEDGSAENARRLARFLDPAAAGHDFRTALDAPADPQAISSS